MDAASIPANPSNSLENAGLAFQVGSREAQPKGNVKQTTSDAVTVSSGARHSTIGSRNPNENVSSGIDLLV